MGIPPLAGFWSKDEILAGANGLGGEGGYKLMLVMGTHRRLLHVRLHDPGHLVRVLRRAAGRGQGRTPPHESGPRITVPLVSWPGWPSSPGSPTCPTPACCPGCPRAVALRFEHFVEPTARLLPERVDATFAHPEFTLWIAVRLDAWSALVGVCARLPLVLEGHRARTASPAGQRAARAGYAVLENKYYLDYLYTDVIAGGIKGPIARAANWVNQNVIDGVVNLAGRGAVEGGQWVYEYIDQGVVDTHRQRLGRDRRGLGAAPAQAADRQGAGLRRLPVRRRHPARRHLRAHRQRQLRTE